MTLIHGCYGYLQFNIPKFLYLVFGKWSAPYFLYIAFTFTPLRRCFFPKRLHTLMTVSAMHGPDQHIRSCLTFSILPKGTCWLRELNLPITTHWPWATATHCHWSVIQQASSSLSECTLHHQRSSHHHWPPCQPEQSFLQPAAAWSQNAASSPSLDAQRLVGLTCTRSRCLWQTGQTNARLYGWYIFLVWLDIG